MAQAPKRLGVELGRQISRTTSRVTNPVSTFSWHIPRHFSTTIPRRASTSPPKLRPPTPKSNARQSSSWARVAPAPVNGLVACGGLLATLLAFWPPTATDEKQRAENANGEQTTATDTRDPSLPRYRLSDVRQHDGASPNRWVTFEDKVYDITSWVAAHPGGDVILRAAGGAIEPYWAIFSIHKQPHVREILDQYLIGFVHVSDLGADGLPAASEIADPFVDDPVRDARLVTHTLKPRNAEPPNEELDREFVTPAELFYVRNHMWVPVVEREGEHAADGHAVTVELPDGEVRRYTVGELKKRFPWHKVTAVLQCSGNRRNDMTRHAAKTNGLQWGVGAISNAEWEGVRLADVLADAGLRAVDPAVLTAERGPSGSGSRAAELGPTSAPTAGPAPGSESRRGSTPTDETSDPDSASSETVNPNTHHVQLTGLEAYGSSIPLTKALDPRGDVLLAFSMNGQPLPRDHGFPLRAVVPGTVAARSVKWLSKIVVADEESPSQWQRRDYKCFGPNEGASPDWDRAPAIQEMPVTSAITRVRVGRECGGGTKMESEVGTKKVGFTPEGTAAATGKAGKSDKETVAPQPVSVQGYAYSGGGREITRVDVSVDGGRTWDQAELLDADPAVTPIHGNKRWAWTRWRYEGTLPPLEAVPSSSGTSVSGSGSGSNSGTGSPTQGERNCTTLVVKATDEAYNTQPETHKAIYNVRGNLATAWHRVKVCPRCVETKDGSGLVWETGETIGCGFGKEKGKVEGAK